MIQGDRKVRSLGFIAGFLLVTNIIMLVFFIGLRDGKKSMHLRENAIGNFLKNDIGFTDGQMSQYQALKKVDLDIMKPYFDGLHNAKDSFYQYVTLPSTPDSNIKIQSSSIGEHQKNLDEQMLLHFRKVRSLCTAEQLPKFDSLFKNVIGKITSGRIKKNYKDQQ